MRIEKSRSQIHSFRVNGPGVASHQGLAFFSVTEDSDDAAVGHGEPVGRLRIPRLALSVMVAEGADPAVLRRGAGHLPNTALPGRGGNVGIAAHRDRHFRPLKDVTSGDEIVLETVVGTFRYQVEWTRIVPPERVDVLHPTDAPALTLVTCYPFYYVGNAPDRFVVRARRLGWEPPRR
ncbi:MAG: class D sortase [Acidobacteriota bacterium]